MPQRRLTIRNPDGVVPTAPVPPPDNPDPVPPPRSTPTPATPDPAWVVQSPLAIIDSEVALDWPSARARITNGVIDGQLVTIRRSLNAAGEAERQRDLQALTLIRGSSHFAKYVPRVRDESAGYTVYDRWSDMSLAEFCGTHDYNARPLVRLEGMHLSWVLKRGLELLGHAHSVGVVHGRMLPHHLHLTGADHGLHVVDWGVSLIATQSHSPVAPAVWRPFFPSEFYGGQRPTAASDMYMLVKSLIWANGGSMQHDTLHPDEPRELQQFLRSLVLTSLTMRPRPNNYQQLHTEFTALSRQLFGRGFVVLDTSR